MLNQTANNLVSFGSGLQVLSWLATPSLLRGGRMDYLSGFSMERGKSGAFLDVVRCNEESTGNPICLHFISGDLEV